MTRLEGRSRNALDRDDFACVDREGGEHLPIHDEAHVRSAISRWDQTHFTSAPDKETARRKILAAAKKHGIEVSPEDRIMKASRR